MNAAQRRAAVIARAVRAMTAHAAAHRVRCRLAMRCAGHYHRTRSIIRAVLARARSQHHLHHRHIAMMFMRAHSLQRQADETQQQQESLEEVHREVKQRDAHRLRERKETAS
ncbi:hypothetical protein [Paraburkholderia phosphatilytica]|uniref:hypothetical protein n=1 Tax=Paraburkholderia phosphatilytica TaxID=2282883 RepID=UPI000F5DD98D|nr:hypothetical protein [Paraburkholderia phosphatilytica]